MFAVGTVALAYFSMLIAPKIWLISKISQGLNWARQHFTAHMVLRTLVISRPVPSTGLPDLHAETGVATIVGYAADPDLFPVPANGARRDW